MFTTDSVMLYELAIEPCYLSDANHHVLYYFTCSIAMCKLMSLVYSHEGPYVKFL
jgi:hypothetical protein